MTPRTAAEAHKLKLRAQRKRKLVDDLPDRNHFINMSDLAKAADMEQAADKFLAVPSPAPMRGTGGELVPPSSRDLPGMEEAVREPGYVAIEASIERIGLADRCGAFNLAFDAAESVRAENAYEQMLAHQTAAAHKMSLDLLAKAAQQRDFQSMASLCNAAARLMDASQKAMLTFHRLRTGGKQTVVVQHVQVGDGGQAVIAGAMNPGGAKTGGPV